MSTPSGKSLNLIDPSASESHETNEWVGAERHPVENNYGPLQSPYAPKKARARIPSGVVSCGEMARDLKRLAASVRWVQREEAAARPPRVAQPRSVSGFAPVDARGRGYGEMFDNGFSSRSLEPDGRVPPSAMSLRRDTVEGGSPTSKAPPGPQMASFDSKFIITAPPRSSSQESSRTIITRDDDPGTLAKGEISYERSELSSAAKSFARAAVATLPPGALGAQDPPLSTAVRALNPDEIMLLMKQGEQFIAAGDLLAARISFQRAAEAGDADAAVALGRPMILLCLQRSVWWE
jgi:hypothetical protein